MADDVMDRRACGCPEDRALSLSRRSLFRALGLVGAATAASPLLSTQVALAAPSYTGDTLVVLSMRGGFDGLSAVVPYGIPAYYHLRPTIGVPQTQLLDGTTNGTFGLHPSFQPLKPFWDNGTFGVVTACGLWAPDRSHFEATAEMERAAPGSSMRSGWLDRVVGVNGLTGSSFQSVVVGSTLPPDSMMGSNPELAMGSLDGFTMSGGDTEDGRTSWTKALKALHSNSPGSLKQPTLTTLAAIKTVAKLRSPDYVPGNGAVYDSHSGFASALRDLARMIKAGVGVQVACVDFGDWDMHVGLQPLHPADDPNGDYWFADHLLEFTSALAAFMTDLGSKMDDVTVVTLTEFGRRAEENDSKGVDHGYGTSVMLAGNGVRGGQIAMEGGSLTLTSDLVDGDLPVRTDYRKVLREILSKRCGVPSGKLASIFPGSPADTLDVIKNKT